MRWLKTEADRVAPSWQSQHLRGGCVVTAATQEPALGFPFPLPLALR